MVKGRILKEIVDNNLVLVLTSSKKYSQTNLTILKHLCNQYNYPGIYVTSSRPYSSLVAVLEKNKIGMNRLFFIDMVSLSSSSASLKAKNCLFMESPRALTELSIALSQAVDAIHMEDKFVYLDSLSTLLIYNEVGTVKRFVHFLTGKMRLWGVKGIVISLEKETSPELLDQLTQFVDKVVKVR